MFSNYDYGYESEDNDYESDNETKIATSSAKKKLELLAAKNLELLSDNDLNSIDLVIIDTLNHIQTMCEDPKEVTHFSDMKLQENLLNIINSSQSRPQKMYLIMNKVYDPQTLEPTSLVKNLKQQLESACAYADVYTEIKKINDEPKKVDLVNQLLKIINKYFNYLTEEKITPLQGKRYNFLLQNKIKKYEDERLRITNLNGHATSLKSDCSRENLINLRTEFNRWKSDLASRIAKSSVDSLGKGQFAEDMERNINTLEGIVLQQQNDSADEFKMRS